MGCKLDVSDQGSRNMEEVGVEGLMIEESLNQTILIVPLCLHGNPILLSLLYISHITDHLPTYSVTDFFLSLLSPHPQ